MGYKIEIMDSFLANSITYFVGRYLQVYPALMQQQRYSQQEHQQLLAACQAQDEQAALRILRQHLEGASERLATFVATLYGEAA